MRFLSGPRVEGLPFGWVLGVLAAVPAFVVAHHAGAVFALLVFVLALGLNPLLVAGFAKLIAFANRGRRERVVATAWLWTTLLVLWFIVFVILRAAA